MPLRTPGGAFSIKFDYETPDAEMLASPLAPAPLFTESAAARQSTAGPVGPVGFQENHFVQDWVKKVEEGVYQHTYTASEYSRDEEGVPYKSTSSDSKKTPTINIASPETNTTQFEGSVGSPSIRADRKEALANLEGRMEQKAFVDLWKNWR